MRYWSKGLARRSALTIDWSEEATQISVEDGQAFLSSVLPLNRVRGELPPEGSQVIVAGDTQPPIVWRYISILAREDFENIVRLATGPGMVRFLTVHPRGWRLFLRLARFLVVFSVRYVGTWLWMRLGWAGRPQRHPHERLPGVADASGMVGPTSPPVIGSSGPGAAGRREGEG